ncbi:MAG: hypothetical protein ABSE16_01415 [Verrucomicrobiota bacterium]|jgi:hypothetical protein
MTATRHKPAFPAVTGLLLAPKPGRRPAPWEEKFADGSSIVHLPDGTMLCIEARPDRVPMLLDPNAPVDYNSPPPPPPSKRRKRKIQGGNVYPPYCPWWS